MYILAIDTSCDDTSVAITENDRILANVISSQIELHKKWGGVVPSLAQRAHAERIGKVINEALQRSGLTLADIDIFAVTNGPGLAIALEVGIKKAKELSKTCRKPLVAVNHMAGHIYANLAKNKEGRAPINSLSYPVLALLLSGGHTELVLLRSETKWEVIGQTLDDAMGEAYDKVAKMLNLGYPGGPIIAQLAKEGDSKAFDFPIPMRQSVDLNFSFSGLKTAVLYKVKQLTNDGQLSLSKQQIIDIAASFQRVAFASIILKLTAAIKQYQPKQILLGGGVISNTELRKAVRQAMKPFGIAVYYPNLKKLCTDNAAMIAVVAYYQAKQGQFADPEKLDRDPSLSL